jgi:uncharacterized caspase-like protein
VGGREIGPGLANERDLRFEAVDLDTVQEQTGAYAKVSILFLGACRDNPFARRLSRGRSFAPRGLSRVDVGREAVLVAFATGPGEVRNSPFTAALLKYTETPGPSAHQAMREPRHFRDWDVDPRFS